MRQDARLLEWVIDGLNGRLSHRLNDGAAQKMLIISGVGLLYTGLVGFSLLVSRLLELL